MYARAFNLHLTAYQHEKFMQLLLPHLINKN